MESSLVIGVIVVAVLAYLWRSEVGRRDDQSSNLERLTARGWLIVHRDAEGVQVRRPKRWSVSGLVLFVLAPALLGVIFPPLWGVALLGLLVVAVLYAMGRDEVRYITAHQAEPPPSPEHGAGTCQVCGYTNQLARRVCKRCKTPLPASPQGTGSISPLRGPGDPPPLSAPSALPTSDLVLPSSAPRANPWVIVAGGVVLLATVIGVQAATNASSATAPVMQPTPTPDLSRTQRLRDHVLGEWSAQTTWRPLIDDVWVDRHIAHARLSGRANPNDSEQARQVCSVLSTFVFDRTNAALGLSSVRVEDRNGKIVAFHSGLSDDC